MQVFRLRGCWDWRPRCPSSSGELRAARLWPATRHMKVMPHQGPVIGPSPSEERDHSPSAPSLSGADPENTPSEHPARRPHRSEPDLDALQAVLLACLPFQGQGMGSRWGVIGTIRASYTPAPSISDTVLVILLNYQLSKSALPIYMQTC